MKGSIYLGKILGIKLLIHFTFFFIFIWVAYTSYDAGNSLPQILFECLIVVVVFICVVMHEYGHALAARRYGIQTSQILLLPIGGVAQLERMPEKPAQELWVAIAGPLVNVAIIIILLPVIFFTYDVSNFYDEAYMEELLRGSFLIRLLLINIVLVLFNLIPAFPMDGGRVLRALLGFKLGYPKATLIAARIGQLLAVGFFLAGIYSSSMLLLVGIFVFVGAEMELRMVTQKHKLRGFTVKHALLQRFTTLLPENTLAFAVKELLAGTEKDFIVAENGVALGVITRERIIEGLSNGDSDQHISDLMMTKLPNVQINQPLEEVLKLMKLFNTAVLPVYNGYQWVGAIDMENITEVLMLNKAIRNKADDFEVDEKLN